jgi:hypothetical protein
MGNPIWRDTRAPARSRTASHRLRWPTLNPRYTGGLCLFTLALLLTPTASGFGKDPASSPNAPADAATSEPASNATTYALPDGRYLTRIRATGEAASPRIVADTSSTGEAAGLSCTIASSTPTTSACNASTFQAGFETAGRGTATHGLLQFPTPALGNNAEVLKAELSVYETSASASGSLAMGAYRVYTPWTTGVTWNTTNGSAPWEQAGGDYGETSGGEFGTKGNPELVESTLTSKKVG